MNRNTKILTALIATIALISSGAALHNDEPCTGDSAHCSQNDKILDNSDRIDHLESKGNDLVQQIQDLESDLESHNQSSNDELQSLKDDLDSVESDIDSLDSDKASKQEVSEVESDLRTLESNVQSAAQDIRDDIQENEESIEDVESSTYTKSELESLLSEKYDKEVVDSMVNSLDSSTYSQSEVDGIVEDAKSSASQDREELESELKSYTDENDAHSDQIELPELSEMIVEFFQRPDNIIKEWVSDNFASQDRVEALEEENQRQEVEIERLRQDVDNLYDAIPYTEDVAEDMKSDKIQTTLQVMKENNISELSVEDDEGDVWNCKWMDKPGTSQERPVCIH